LPELDAIPAGHANLFCAFLWNANRVNILDAFPLDVPNPHLAGANIFPRIPLVGYFEAIEDGDGTNDFVLINLHLKSGQHHDENHMIAVVVLEHGLTTGLHSNAIKESDRIVLGDFNDNPYAERVNGKQRFSDALYDHMAFKGYMDLVTEDFHSTRMNTSLTSIIDHILVNVSARQHILQEKADIFLPGPNSTFGTWRKTFSDHFPISFKLKIDNSDDDVDF